MTIEEGRLPEGGSTEVLQSLRNTPYACSSIHELNEGLANVTYRGQLNYRLWSSSTADRGVPNTLVSPCQPPDVYHTEPRVLEALQDTPVRQVHHNGTTIQCPRVYDYIPQQNIRILEDFPHDSIGKALGTWLGRFHAWSLNGVDEGLAEAIKVNTDFLTKDISTVRLRFFQRECADEKVRRYVENLLFPNPNRRRTDTVTMTHGDFTTRNILFQEPSSLATVDWETCCYADFTRDLASMVGD
ncbi:aminoglycoside phosphotransferase family protein [Aspergillus undulatus]|uniref:aminoglycoside phosphotransferase family protein n=1 Tax=Aspergillus undulatus TaxID=1810928 RepID=UPI003CCDD66E